jgi:major membrane immunogen (membrane-anchored lipoprotein)
MKKAKRLTVCFVLAFSLLVGMTGAAFAAESTGMKDDFYSAQTEPDANGLYYKVTALVEGGKVSTFSYEFHGSRKLTEDILAYMPEDFQPVAKATLAEQKYYMELVNNGEDPANVSKYPEAANDAVYSALQTLWKDIVSQAGGTIADGASAAQTSTSDSESSAPISNPKTGDTGILLYVAAAGVALLSMVALRKKTIVQ